MVSVKLAVLSPQWAVMMAVPRPLVMMRQKFFSLVTLFSTAATVSSLLSQVTVVLAPSSASNSARTEEEYTVPISLMLSFSSVRSVSVEAFFSTRLVTLGCAATPETVMVPGVKDTLVISVVDSPSSFKNTEGLFSVAANLTSYLPLGAESFTAKVSENISPSSV